MAPDQTAGGRSVVAENFQALLTSEVCSMHFDLEQPAALEERPQFSTLQAGLIGVYEHCGFTEQWCVRGPELIDADSADYYVVCTTLQGLFDVQQGPAATKLSEGSFTILQTQQPFTGKVRPNSTSELFSTAHVRIPAALLRGHAPDVDDLCGHAIHADPVRRRMLSSLLTTAVKDGAQLRDTERERLGDLLLELIYQFVADGMQGDDPMPVLCNGSHRHAYDKALRFIAANLKNPELDPAAIAEHCHISVRYLYTCFTAITGRTVTETIREHRLIAARGALRNPSRSDETITRIASDWGFDDPSHFGRLYRHRFGLTPREDRCLPARQGASVPEG